MNPDLNKLQPYPFEKLTKLKAAVSPNTELPHIALSIGEPKHPAPDFVQQALTDNIKRLENYPTTKGLPELNQAIADWLKQRFSLDAIDAVSQVIPVNGTREAIFAFTQAAVDRSASNPLVVSPNPFYQIYEGAAYLAGAEPHFLPCLEENGFMPDFDKVAPQVAGVCFNLPSPPGGQMGQMGGQMGQMSIGMMDPISHNGGGQMGNQMGAQMKFSLPPAPGPTTPGGGGPQMATQAGGITPTPVTPGAPAPATPGPATTCRCVATSLVPQDNNIE